MSPCPLLFIYTLLLQRVILRFCKGNLFGCGQLFHTQNRCALSASDQLCLPVDYSLALSSQFTNDVCHSVPQMALPVVLVAGHGPPLPSAIVLDQHTARACMLPMSFWARALSEQLYCCSTCLFIALPNRSMTHLLLALQQVRVQTSC